MKKKFKLLMQIFLLVLLFLPVQGREVQAASLKTPALVKVVSVNYSTLKVQWKKVSGAAGYRVFRKSGNSAYKKIADVAGNKTEYSDQKAQTGTKYTYTVRAYKGSVMSGFSSKGISGTAQLEKPAIKSITAGSSNQLTITWGKVDGASGYVVCRAVGTSGKLSVLKTLGAGVVSYTDTGLESGSTYYYSIRAWRNVGGKKVYSAYSAKKGKKTAEESMSFEAFAKTVAELIKKYNIDLGNIGDIKDKFFSKRLIVKAKSSDVSFEKYNPLVILKGPENLCLLQFETEEDTRRALQELKGSSKVQYVEADSVSSTDGTSFGAAATQHKSWGVEKINADAYAQYVASVTNSSIKVAVVDSGVSTHPFLSGRLDAGGYDFVDVDSDPSDQNGHGTHVSGTIVDCTPGLNVKILPVRVLDRRGSGYTSVVASGIRYAADHGAKVINLSLGGGHSSLLDEMIDYAIKKGVTVVVAAGNESSDTSTACPAHMTNAIVVGAVDSSNRKAYFSNTGKSLDVVAPGVNIVSSVPGGGYASYDGTSMATPHVAAVAAMIKLVSPGKTPAQVEALIKKNTQDLGSSGWDSSYGYGIPKLNPPSQPEKVVLDRTSASLKVGGTLTLKASVQPDYASQSVTWSSSNTRIATVNSSGVVTAKAEGTANITASTGNGKKASCTVKVTPNEVPVTGITINKTSASLKVGGTVTLSATVSPSNATDRTVTWSSNDVGTASVNNNGVVTANSKGEAVITATTSNGKSASCTVTVTDGTVEINLDKRFYTCKSGDELMIEAEIILPEKVTLNQRKYILFTAVMGLGWKQLSAYNVGGTREYLEPREAGKTTIYSCVPQGNKLTVKMGIDTSEMKASALMKMLKLAIFPYNNFSAGKSMHDEIFFVSVK